MARCFVGGCFVGGVIVVGGANGFWVSLLMRVVVGGTCVGIGCGGRGVGCCFEEGCCVVGLLMLGCRC